MKLETYCPADKKGNFLFLLNFARITKFPTDPVWPAHEKNVIIETINSLPDSFNPSLRAVIPLIYHNTEKAGLRDLLHPETQIFLKDNTLLLVCVEMLNQQWLKNGLTVFKKENIPVILLKGAAFPGSLYPGNTPRVGVDLDLLVSESDFKPACALLDKTMNTIVQSNERLATHDTLFERVFSPKNGTRPTVEIHRALTNPSIFNINEEKLWKASRKHPAFNSNLIRILSPEDTLLHLAVHAFRDLNFCTHNILDAHEVWCQWRPDPDLLFTRAAQWGAINVLYYLLENAREIMGTPIDKKLIEKIKPGRFRNRLNREILQTSPRTTASPPFKYRALQLVAQLTFPDNPLQGMKYQAHYLQTRIRDKKTKYSVS